MTSCAIIGDIGGTNARFAVVFDHLAEWHYEQTLPVADYPTLKDALNAYLQTLPELMPTRAALCVACPVLGDRIAFTNSPWTFSQSQLQDEMGWEMLVVVNDFVGNALACPHLADEHRVAIGDGLIAREGFPVAVLGPGTGLGVALLVPAPTGGWLPVATEGGHVTLPARNDAEADVLARVRHHLRAHGADDHVSAERLLCGAGLALLHQVLSQGQAPLAPAQVTTMAVGDSPDPHAYQALSMFCNFLGSVAGNLVLSSGALGGVVLMGGILPRILPFFQASHFRTAFEQKGRFESYLKQIPCHVVTHPYPAFVGLAGVVQRSL